MLKMKKQKLLISLLIGVSIIGVSCGKVLQMQQIQMQVLLV